MSGTNCYIFQQHGAILRDVVVVRVTGVFVIVVVVVVVMLVEVVIVAVTLEISWV